MTKRILTLFTCITIIILNLCGCNNSSTETKEKSTKGTRNDPYKIGDTIKFTASYEEQDFDIELNVNEVILDSNEIKQMYRDNNILPSKYDNMLVKFSFVCNGDYDNDIDIENLVLPVEVSSDMKEDACYGTLHDENMERISSVYTGVNYEFYEGSDEFEANEYKYIRFEYENPDGEECSIWVDITQ